MNPLIPLTSHLHLELVPMPLQILIPVARHSRLSPIVDAKRSLYLASKVLLDELPKPAYWIDVQLAADVGEPSVPGGDVRNLVKVDNLHHLATGDVACLFKLFDRDRVDLQGVVGARDQYRRDQFYMSAKMDLHPTPWPRGPSG
jgi:hypothetical protein